MINRRTDYGIVILGIVFSFMFIAVMTNYFMLAAKPEYTQENLRQQEITINVSTEEGMIYDRYMQPLVNRESIYKAVAVPQLVDAEKLSEYAVDTESFLEEFNKGEPFIFECSEKLDDSQGITVFEVPVRYDDQQLAIHTVGYTSQGSGVTGIEYAYDKILRGNYGENSVTYSADGFGNILLGVEKSVSYSDNTKCGVAVTIDSDIQKICQDAGKQIKSGAIIVSQVNTGDILAMASFPEYSLDDLETAVNDKSSPMINRCLYSYSVGSIFKLVTACEAIQEGYSGYMYNCEGNIGVNGKKFKCHKLEGHGIQSMTDAMVNSCNTYFIDISQLLSIASLRETAFELGFGREIHLCAGITASAGVLPSVKDLKIPAELANFSFGQGKLTASPMQISQLTCAIANGGKMPVMRLIRGLTENGEKVENEKAPQYSYSMEAETAEALKDMMIAAVEKNENSNARPHYTTAAAKTSTAQTGQYDENGNEKCNAWITGFFPADNPRFAVTVLVEDGGYGNDSAAPVFRKIADNITKLAEKD